MRTIETVATIDADGTLTAKLPPDIEPGQHRVVVVIDEARTEPAERGRSESFPVLELHAFPWTNWPADATFRREDLYDDDGR
jgi:hypothetical protein